MNCKKELRTDLTYVARERSQPRIAEVVENIVLVRERRESVELDSVNRAVVSLKLQRT